MVQCNRVNVLAITIQYTAYKPNINLDVLTSAVVCFYFYIDMCSYLGGRLGTGRLINVNIEQHCQLHRWPTSLGNRSCKEINGLPRLGGASKIFQSFMSYLHRAADNCVPSGCS